MMTGRHRDQNLREHRETQPAAPMSLTQRIAGQQIIPFFIQPQPRITSSRSHRSRRIPVKMVGLNRYWQTIKSAAPHLKVFLQP